MGGEVAKRFRIPRSSVRSLVIRYGNASRERLQDVRTSSRSSSIPPTQEQTVSWTCMLRARCKHFVLTWLAGDA